MSNMPVPDFTDVDPQVQAAAMAVMNRDVTLVPPDDAQKNTDKNGNDYFRWSEPAVIEAAWREGTKTGLLSAVVQYKVRAGSHNGGVRNWARHTMHPSILAGTADDEITKKYQFMNDRSIAALTTLLSAAGFQSTGLSAKLLNMMFPVKNSPGATTPLKGKTVFLNLTNSPNKGEMAEKKPRQTNVESYTPDTPEDE